MFFNLFFTYLDIHQLTCSNSCSYCTYRKITDWSVQTAADHCFHHANKSVRDNKYENNRRGSVYSLHFVLSNLRTYIA